jgi:aromatic ring-opening dioxygenase catalytic subunit (LigB family)
MPVLMPAIFFGHGNPMNAIEQNAYTGRWAEIGARIPRPKSILCISAHWYVPGAAVTVSTAPRTIHDFGGFPKPLYEVQYPAPGDPSLAQRVQNLLAPIPVALDQRWGWITGRGRYFVMCIRRRIFRWYNSASMKHNRRYFISKSDVDLPNFVMKVY